MTFPDFAFVYALATLIGLFLLRRRLTGDWRLVARTLAGITLVLCICDGVTESRPFWHFPATLGVYLLDVPLENVLVTFAAVTHSLILFLLLDGRGRAAPPGPRADS